MSDISKINVNGDEYDVKDAYVRHIINILLGIESEENNNEEEG